MSEDLLALLQVADEKEREWLLIRQVLKAMPSALQVAAWASAIPHWFDQPFLDALLEPDEQAAFMQEGGLERLAQYTFVESLPGMGFNIHERSRNVLLTRLWDNDRVRFLELSTRAAEYCAHHLEYDEYQIERIYHLLVADPQTGVDDMLSSGRRWQNSPKFDYDKVEVMTKVAREHADCGRLEDRGLGWTIFWEGHLDRLYSRNLEAKVKLTSIDMLSVDDRFLIAIQSTALGDVHRILAEYDLAQKRYEDALPIYRSIGNQLGEANCLKALGDVKLSKVQYSSARDLYEEALPIYKAIDSRLGEANCLYSIGEMNLHLAVYDVARRQFEEALPIYIDVGSVRGRANCIKALGDIQLQMAEYSLAHIQFEQALSIYRDLGDPLGEANSLQSLGDASRMVDEFSLARGHYEKALNIYRDIGARLGEANCILYQAHVDRSLGVLEEARMGFEQATSIYLDIDDQWGQVECLSGRADIDRLNGDWEEASEKYAQALAFYREKGMRNEEAYTLRRIGHAAKGAGDLAAARRHYKAALQLYKQIGWKRIDEVRADLESLS